MLEIHVDFALFLAYPMDLCRSIAQGNWISRGNLSTLKLHFFGVSWLIIFQYRATSARRADTSPGGNFALHPVEKTNKAAKKWVDLSQANRSEFHGLQ